MVKESDFKVFAESFLKIVNETWDAFLYYHINKTSKDSKLCKFIYIFLTKNKFVEDETFKELSKHYAEKIDVFLELINANFKSAVNDHKNPENLKIPFAMFDKSWCRVLIGSSKKVKYKETEFTITNKEYFSVNRNIFSWQGIDEFFVALENIINELRDFCLKNNLGVSLKFPSSLNDMIGLGDSIVIHYDTPETFDLRKLVEEKLDIYNLLKIREFRQKSGFDIKLPDINGPYQFEKDRSASHTEAIAMIIIYDFYENFVKGKEKLDISLDYFIIWFKAELLILNSLKLDEFMERFSKFAA